MGNSPSADSVQTAALQLDVASRMKLTMALVDSLSNLLQTEIDQAWLIEATRRDAEIESGEVKALSGPEVFASIRARYS